MECWDWSEEHDTFDFGIWEMMPCWGKKEECKGAETLDLRG